MAGQSVEEKIIMGPALPESNTLVRNTWNLITFIISNINFVFLQVFYQPRGRRLEVFQPNESDSSLVYELDFNIHSLYLVMNDRIMVQSEDSNK